MADAGGAKVGPERRLTIGAGTRSTLRLSGIAGEEAGRDVRPGIRESVAWSVDIVGEQGDQRVRSPDA
jgi:hypothetical protein